MKTLIAIIFLALISLVSCAGSPPKSKEEMKEIISKCKEENGFEGVYKDIPKENAPNNAKCFIKCLFEKKELLKKDGTFDLEVAKAYVNASDSIDSERKGKTIKAIEECSNEVKINLDDLCESTYQFFSCKMKKLYP